MNSFWSLPFGIQLVIVGWAGIALAMAASIGYDAWYRWNCRRQRVDAQIERGFAAMREDPVVRSRMLGSIEPRRRLAHVWTPPEPKP